jgi:hypothetical protein
MSEETVMIQIPRRAAEELIHILGNYMDHYTEDDYYNGEPEIPLLFMSLLSATHVR